MRLRPSQRCRTSLLRGLRLTSKTRCSAELAAWAPGNPFRGAEPVHFAGRSSVRIYYRDGHEVAEDGAPKRKKHEVPAYDFSSSGYTLTTAASADSGYHEQETVDAETRTQASYEPPAYAYTTSGEFGPTLAAVLMDTTHGGVLWEHVTWDHWEQGAEGLIAVFHYAVPEGASHYRDLGVLPARHTAATRALPLPTLPTSQSSARGLPISRLSRGDRGQSDRRFNSARDDGGGAEAVRSHYQG